MPVFIYESDAFDKLCQVEGEEYRKCKTKEEFRDCSFDAFLEKWQEINEYIKTSGRVFTDDTLDRPGSGITVDGGNTTIYGLGGWNRYGVTFRGEIIMIEAQAVVKSYIELAKKVGFRTF